MIKRLTDYVSSPQYRGAGLTFFLMSVLFSFWVTRLPSVRDKLSLSEAEIGLALFFIPMGALTAMLVSHAVNRRFGEGRMMSAGLVLLAIAGIFPVLAGNFLLLCISLFFFGFFMGLTDISMNAVVSMFEKKNDVHIMSASHGFFSLGGMIGAPVGGLVAGSDISPLLQMAVTAVIIIVIVVLVIWPHTFDSREEHEGNEEPLMAIPRGGLIPLALMAFCTMMGEGSVADWSAIYLKDVVAAPEYLLGFGYAAFSFTMTLGRFYGDQLSARFGAQKLLLTGYFIAILGFAFTLFGGFYVSLLGFTLIGAGFASIIPELFRSAGRTQGYSSSYGIAAVASTGYFGFLLGPVLIGFIAEYQGLRASFLLLMLLISVALVLVRPSYRARGSSGS